MMRTLRWAVGIGLLLTAATAAAFQTFRIEEIYSNGDGTVQYVVLHESSGADGQQFLGGHTLVVTYGAVTKTFTFPSDLPSASTANTRVLIATAGFASLGLVTPDYVIPAQFLPGYGGTLNYAGVDQVAFGPLPSDGFHAIDRNGTSKANLATNFGGQSAAAPPLPVTVVEYYAASLDHYFITPVAAEIDALDSGRIPGWVRTGQSFLAYSSQAAADLAASPVCRFYIPPVDGDSHFFSASQDECAGLLQKVMTDPRYSGFVYETPNLFYIDLPPNLVTGICPPLTIPVYRLYNNRADTNHRYTTDPAIKAQMVAKGYIPEGYGPDSVDMCAPTGQPIDRTTLKINGLAWLGNQFVAVAGQGGGSGTIISSIDGITWTPRDAGPPGLRGVGWSGTQAVIVGQSGAVLSSPDGLVWTAQKSNSANDLNFVVWCGTQWAALGNAGTILTSPDGVTWTLRPSKTAANLNSAILSGSHVLVVGAAGTILSSTDCTSWAMRTSGTANDLFGITQTASKLIAVGSGGTVLTSSDGGSSWATANSGTTTTLNAAAYGPQVVAVGASGKIISSNAGSNWSNQHSFINQALYEVAWSGSQFAAVGDLGSIITSPDGVTWTSR
ncbi:MAG TPA: hypothetical protein VMQ50_01820 [Casimicrobiaceae bacterium]|nr:hypothetical protein [Casimicrobiaceae bacterium]